MTISITTSTFSWPSKKAAKGEFQRIKDSYRPGERVTDPIDVQMLFEILERHPDYAEKVGAGIAYFFVDLTSKGDKVNVRRDATGIWLARIDRSVVDFSYITCIDQHTARSDAKEGLRAAVDSQRAAYRDSRFALGPVVSDLTSAPISDKSQASVIYIAPTWEQLTYAFAMSEGGWSNVLVGGGRGNVKIGSSLVDPAVERRWLQFFAKHAVLGLATASEAARRPRGDETAWAP